jgi:hypothetical protein
MSLIRMAFGRLSWQHIQDNQMIILYMLISVCAFSYIYYLTAKIPINLEESKVDQKQKEDVKEEYSMPMDHLKDPSNYNMQNFANTRQQHYDARDMGKIGVPAASGHM